MAHYSLPQMEEVVELEDALASLERCLCKKIWRYEKNENYLNASLVQEIINTKIIEIPKYQR